MKILFANFFLTHKISKVCLRRILVRSELHFWKPYEFKRLLIFGSDHSFQTIQKKPGWICGYKTENYQIVHLLIVRLCCLHSTIYFQYVTWIFWGYEDFLSRKVLKMPHRRPKLLVKSVTSCKVAYISFLFTTYAKLLYFYEHH